MAKSHEHWGISAKEEEKEAWDGKGEGIPCII